MANDTSLEKPFADRVVRDVRRDDADDIDPVLALRLGLGHAAKIGVAAHRIEPQVAARFNRPLRIGAERAGDQFIAIVEPSGDPVRLADEGAASAAHHAQAQAGRRRGCHVTSSDRKLLISDFLFAELDADNSSSAWTIVTFITLQVFRAK